MKKSQTEFDERIFLMTLLNKYKIKYGNEIRFIDSFEFNAVDTWLGKYFIDAIQEKTFRTKDGGTAKEIKYPTLAWLKEGSARGLVNQKSNSNGLVYTFSEKGYLKAMNYSQSPFRYFFENKWGIFAKNIAFIAAICTIVSTLIQILIAFKIIHD
nr:hypothetical protein [uncultured Desulfobacter sp.]